MEQFHEAVQDLIRKPKPERGPKNLDKALLWTLDKDDINQILSKIERLRKPCELSLQNNNFVLSQEIKNDTTEVVQKFPDQRSRDKCWVIA